jgi:hypothetical protein
VQSQQEMKSSPVNWGQPAKQSYLLLPRPLLWWRQLL